MNSDLKLGQNLQQFLKFHYFINLPLPAMYLCKEAFPVLTIIKSKSTLKTSGNVVLKYKTFIQV